ncbi:MAG: hypothetical protein RLZZ165_1797 [Bacteroidota bacterium]
MKFKTNIKCGGCVSTVTPVLDAAVGMGNWTVDLADPLRTLHIKTESVSPADIRSRLAAVGYEAELLPAS